MNHLFHQAQQTYKNKNMEESFNEWMLRIKSEYYADNAQMDKAFERLRNQKSNRDENITKHSAMDNRS